MYIDTHCHIDKENAALYIENAEKANVKILINASEDFQSSLEGVELSESYSNVFTCIGVHPLDVKEFNTKDINEFLDLLNNKNVIAIGEIGLDYYYSKDDKIKQQKVFRMFLELAQEYNLPVVIHSREATLDTINILKEYNVKGIIHCFSGSLETAKEYINMGFLLGIGGVLTFKNSKLYEVVKEIPLSYIVLETDAPFLTPEPYRKYKNESKYIPDIAECLAKHKEITVEEVMQVTTENAKRIFDI